MTLRTVCLAVLLAFSLSAAAAISRDKAEAIALKQVPGAQIAGGSLDKLNGRLVWSLDLNQPGSRNFTEVTIDAESGKVLRVRLETPADQVGRLSHQGQPL
ncbi:MAG: PepSY domain-containing protein [Betaproteobacteria bacterium]